MSKERALEAIPHARGMRQQVVHGDLLRHLQVGIVGKADRTFLVVHMDDPVGVVRG